MDVPEHWRFRDGTHDREIWRCVVECDEYRMAGRDIHPVNDVIIDVGGHIGCFAWLARKVCLNVHSFEPEKESYRLLKHNSGATCYNAALWRSDGPVNQLLHYQKSTNPANTGGGDCLGDVLPHTYPVLATSFDWFMGNLKSRVRLLKLDCEGSEFPILLTSQKLHLVDEIIGEYHELPYGDKVIPEHAKVHGHEAWTRDVLRACLERNGFEVELNHEAENIGKFFARRT